MNFCALGLSDLELRHLFYHALAHLLHLEGHITGRGTFESLSRQLAAQLGATGEACFRRELQEMPQKGGKWMKIYENRLYSPLNMAIRPILHLQKGCRDLSLVTDWQEVRQRCLAAMQAVEAAMMPLDLAF